MRQCGRHSRKACPHQGWQSGAATGHEFEHVTTPDTGATRTVISLDLIVHSNIPYSQTSCNIYMASAEKMACEGTVELDVPAEDCPDCTTISALISSSIKDVLLSWHDLRHLGAISSHFPLKDRPEMVAAVSIASGRRGRRRAIKSRKKTTPAFGLNSEPLGIRKTPACTSLAINIIHRVSGLGHKERSQ